MKGREYHGAAEMLDSYLDVLPFVEPQASIEQFESYIGHIVATGEIDATEALKALEAHAKYMDDGEPKMVK